jgi:hypothetical protein
VDVTAAISTRLDEWSALIEPATGVTVWRALAELDPQGFHHIEVYPNGTARVFLTERVFADA